MTDLLEKFAEVAPKKMALAKLAYAMLDNSPYKNDVDEELYALMKQAELGTFAKGIAATVGAGIAYNLAGEIYNKVRYGVTKSKDFKAMMKENPALMHHDQHRVKRVFDSLHTMAPHLAADPLVAGEFVESKMGSGTMADLNSLDKLVGIRQSMQSGRELGVHDIPSFGTSRHLPDLSEKTAESAEAPGHLSIPELRRKLKKEKLVSTHDADELADEAEETIKATNKAVDKLVDRPKTKQASYDAEGQFVHTAYGLRFIPR